MGERATLTTAPRRHRQPVAEAGKRVISRPPRCVTTKASRRAASRYIRVLAGWLKFCPQPVGFSQAFCGQREVGAYNQSGWFSDPTAAGLTRSLQITDMKRSGRD